MNTLRPDLFRVAACVLLVATGVSGCSRRQEGFRATPQRTLEFLQGVGARTVYFNGAAYADMVAAKPGWLREEGRVGPGERVRSMSQAAQNSKVFRILDRQERFDSVLLAGDPVVYKPLLEHLLTAGDWHLEWVDPYALVYRRGAGETLTAEAIRAEARRWDSAPVVERACAWSAMAERLVVARRGEEAGEWLEAAKALNAGVPEVFVAAGNFHLARGEWARAVSATDAALKLRKGDRPAMAVRAQAFYFSNQFEKAYEVSRKLLQGAPDDPVMLFAHAKISHEVRSLEEEIEVLRKLIGIAEREGRSTSWYRVYLGQALGMTGDAEGAMAELSRVLADPDLPQDQRDFAQSARNKVSSRVQPAPPSK